MSKKSTKKAIGYLGMGIFAIIGFIFGLVLFGLLYSWYLLGFADATTVILTAILLIVVIYVFNYLAYAIGKRHGVVYQKAVFFGIGFTVGLMIVAFILSQMGLESSTSVTVGGLIFAMKSRFSLHKLPTS